MLLAVLHTLPSMNLVVSIISKNDSTAQALANTAGTSPDDDWGEHETPWTFQEDALIVQTWGNGSNPFEISEYLPGRNPSSCRRRYLELHASWAKELKRKLTGDPSVATREVHPTTSEGCVEQSYSMVALASNMTTSSPASDDVASVSMDDDSSSQTTTSSDDVPNSPWVDYFNPDNASQFSALEPVAVGMVVDVYRAWLQPHDTHDVSSRPTGNSGSSPSGSAPFGPNGSFPPSSGRSSTTGLGSKSTSQQGRRSQPRPSWPMVGARHNS